MEMYEINKYLDKFKESVKDLEIAINPQELKAKLDEINQIMGADGFWNNQREANKTIEKLNALKAKDDLLSSIKKGYQDVLETFDLYQMEETDESLMFLSEMIEAFDKSLDEATVKTILSGEYDNNNAILEIHPGAGGTESMDWAQMLLRMYQRYAQTHNFKFKIIDYLAGEEAGLKSVTCEVTGLNAYGYLKAERGVHRLVRISPFDTNKRRHTSFASVDVSPIIDEVKDVEIKDEDLRIDTFCSSGPGGQGVNTTYSAVRITHKPTGIVVNCQNERSQLQNREQAMMVLKSKLLDLELRKQEEELAKIKGGSQAIAFGSQIRSYVFCPYTLVKDHRSNVENGNVTAVMDGDLDSFIFGYLKWMCKND